MARDPDLPVEECLVQLLQHLAIVEAHVAACRAADWQGPTTAHPDLVASLTLMCPPALDPSALHPSASRLLVVTGDQGPAAARIRQLLTTLPGATSLTLRDYVSLMWSDVIADRTADIGTALLEFLHRMEQRHPSPAVRLLEGEGEVAGISYRIRGAGPPLVLLPLELVPSRKPRPKAPPSSPSRTTARWGRSPDGTSGVGVNVLVRGGAGCGEAHPRAQWRGSIEPTRRRTNCLSHQTLCCCVWKNCRKPFQLHKTALAQTRSHPYICQEVQHEAIERLGFFEVNGMPRAGHLCQLRMRYIALEHFDHRRQRDRVVLADDQ